MKAFLAALAFVAVTMTVTGLGYNVISVSATDAFSRESARVERQAPVDGRLDWANEHHD
ncbi:hypothetical protein [Caenispirillum bisanense]|uniref:hypothetical protein n=1 Tax=Caenispirillum bisanense TaxID=414052 RepID=UPI0031CF0471